MRILNIAAFAVSAYASSDGRLCKPFNPLLGETYEADFPEKGLRFFSEKVSFILFFAAKSECSDLCKKKISIL
jgi:Oxysterol-binding protein